MNLSTTDTKVSLACLGTMSFGAHVDEQTACEIMDRAVELGITFFDTAELYAIPSQSETCGVTETIIGKWLHRTGMRDKIVLATKVVGPEHGLSWIRDGKSCLDEKNIRSAIEGSLRRLQTDSIDLYQLHWSDRAVPKFGRRYFHADDFATEGVAIEETLTVLQQLQDEGKVKHFGLSNETPWGTMRFLQIAREKSLPRMVSIQNNYSLLTRTYDIAMAEVSMQEEIGLLAYSPLGFGVLGGRYLDGNNPKGGRFTKYPDFNPRYRTPKVEAAIKRYKQLAETHGMSLATLALAFVYHRPYLTSNIIGPSNVAQLEECVAALDVQWTTELEAGIEDIDTQFTNPCP